MHAWMKKILSENGVTNIGLGGEVYASRDLTVGLEMKYNLIQDFDQAMAAVRIAYNF
jgi:outer membrane protein X